MTAPEDNQRHILSRHCWCQPEVVNYEKDDWAGRVAAEEEERNA